MKVKRKIRHLLHEHDIHDYCKITTERIIKGYDHTQKYFAMNNPDGTTELVDVTSLSGEPIYDGDKTKEVHR